VQTVLNGYLKKANVLGRDGVRKGGNQFRRDGDARRGRHDGEETQAALLELSLNVTLMSTPPYVPYQAYRVCICVFSCPLD
jgi:hypothetical protein